MKQVVWLLVWDCFSRESGRYNFVDSDSYRGSYLQIGGGGLDVAPAMAGCSGRGAIAGFQRRALAMVAEG